MWIHWLNFAQRPVFSGLRFFNETEISDSVSPSRRTCAQNFYVLKKSIDLSRVWTREPWISRQACYPETTEADLQNYLQYIMMEAQTTYFIMSMFGLSSPAKYGLPLSVRTTSFSTIHWTFRQNIWCCSGFNSNRLRLKKKSIKKLMNRYPFLIPTFVLIIYYIIIGAINFTLTKSL